MAYEITLCIILPDVDSPDVAYNSVEYIMDAANIEIRDYTILNMNKLDEDWEC
jgi:hypothetical protein